MKAWQVTEWCEPEQMTFADIPLAEPGPREIRIRNRAAALNFFDILLIQGKYQSRPPFPFTPGNEVAGTVDAVGSEVKEFSVGDRVQAMTSMNGYAEYSIASAHRSFRIPDLMSFEEAAAMPVIYQTSYLALKDRGQLKAGEWLLVHAAAGGVGSSAVQLGKASGAKVIATVGSPEKFDFCRAQGADFVLDYSDESWVDEVKRITGGRGADVIYDPVGGDIFDQSTKCIAMEGRLLVIGFAGGRIPSIAANRILLKNCSIVGCYWGGYIERHPEYTAKAQQDLFRLYEEGKIKPAVSSVYPLAQAPRAMRDLADRKVIGKAILVMGEV
jgi:NADPH2:quinone reductase